VLFGSFMNVRFKFPISKYIFSYRGKMPLIQSRVFPLLSRSHKSKAFGGAAVYKEDRFFLNLGLK
jgi:hypothetical protein